MEKIKAFVKKETVLTIAWVLAVISAFFVHPSKEYIGYIDFQSLLILWSLMIIVAGLKENGLFERIGQALLLKTKKLWQLSAVLIFLCFFFSMFITNDVALITFVPFAMYILTRCNKKAAIIPVVVLQTIAANLGSMLLPIGNPQNIYLYGVSGISLTEFISYMLPYFIAAFVLIIISMLFIKDKGSDIKAELSSDITKSAIHKNIIYGILFILSLLVVARLIPYYILALCVLVCVLIFDRKTIVKIDYALLFTFVGFFIFTGNLGNIDILREMFIKLVNEREVVAAVVTSQFISNVPAALLLSDFTMNIKGLIIGTNLGGLGTLIASMASLISYKSLAHNHGDIKGKYFIVFTIVNVIYLAVLLALYFVIG